jgi:hypothetical protein
MLHKIIRKTFINMSNIYFKTNNHTKNMSKYSSHYESKSFYIPKFPNQYPKTLNTLIFYSFS